MKLCCYILIISALIISCDTKKDYIQEVYVNEQIDLSLPVYSDISITGNSIFISGGVEGIIIYHGIGNDYKAYDRNCSVEPSLACSRIDSINAGIAFCGCCPAAFLISNTGEAIHHAQLPLKSYYCVLNNNILTITN